MKKINLYVLIVLGLIATLCWSVGTLAENKVSGSDQSQTSLEATEGILTMDDINKIRAELYADGQEFCVGENPATKIPLKKLCGLDPNKAPKDKSHDTIIDAKNPVLGTYPASYDWRSYGMVPAIRDQLNCGSCWAFSTCTPFETAVRFKDGYMPDYSEQWLVSCNTSGWGCSGGWFAHSYHVSPGAVNESCFPYEGWDEPCSNHSCPNVNRLTSWYYVTNSSSVPAASYIKDKIYHYGVVSAAVAVGSQFQAYTGGIFSYNYTGSVNHAIGLVGYNDSYSYWILRNSWGPYWGESGYMRIKYGVSKVGYAACYVIYKNSSLQ